MVEDNAINATVLMGLLKRWKVNHSWAAGGLEALELLRVDTFNMVLMDLHMPEMDGFETILRARAMGIFIPILAITADTQPESFDKARRAGANGCIVKPYAAKSCVSPLKRRSTASYVYDLIAKAASIPDFRKLNYLHEWG